MPHRSTPAVTGHRANGSGADAPTVALRSPAEPAPPDRSERAERSKRARTSTSDVESARIDDTLTRITAAHAGVVLDRPLAGQDEPGEEAPAEPARRRRPRPTVPKLVAAALALIVLMTTAFGWASKGWLASAVRDVAALDPESGAIVNAEAQSGDENVLVIAGDPAAADQAGPRADTVTVAHVPAGGGPMAVVSFPPDMEINRPPCERWDARAGTYREDEVVPAAARTRLVSALDIGGPRCATRVVQQLSGIAITGFVGMDIGALGAVANAVGGIAVCAPRPVVDGALGTVVPAAGRTTLDGLRATDYARAIDVRGDPATDRGRVERQQLVLAAVLDQAIGGLGPLDVGQVAALRPALGRALTAEGVGIDRMLSLARSLGDLEAGGVTFASVPTGNADSQGYPVLRDTDAAALFGAVRADTPLPAQTGASGSAAAPTPGELTVGVTNASDRTGLGAKIADTLGSLGFRVGTVGNAEQATEQTLIRFSPDQASGAALLATTVTSATPVPDPGATGVLELVIGRSFDDVLRPPAVPSPDAAAGSDEAEPPRVTCG